MILRTHNRIILLENSEKYIAALKNAIDSAHHNIFLETYIFKNDLFGKTIAQALCNAAKRGVFVHLVLDGFGARNVQKDFLPSFERAHVHTLFFRPEKSLFDFQKKRFRRLHRKLCVVDEQIAFIGGMNIDCALQGTLRLDFSAQIEGEVVLDILKSLKKLAQKLYRIQKIKMPQAPVVHHRLPNILEEECAEIAFLMRDNVQHRHDILFGYLRAIESAKKEIIIANAYFLPGFWLSKALLNAASRGVKIRIILQGKSNVPFLLSATRFLYQKLIQAGIEINEYQPGLLHAKVAVIDERWCTIGSSNMDPFSLRLNQEANVLVLHPPLAQKIKKILMLTVEKHCMHYPEQALKHFGLGQKMLQAASFFVIRSLFHFLRYTNEQWDDH